MQKHNHKEHFFFQCLERHIREELKVSWYIPPDQIEDTVARILDNLAEKLAREAVKGDDT